MLAGQVARRGDMSSNQPPLNRLGDDWTAASTTAMVAYARVYVQSFGDDVLLVISHIVADRVGESDRIL